MSDIITEKHDSELEECTGDCLNCLYLFRFDICRPEYETNLYLEV